jgi:predicted RNase H-like HicB family nuclease
MVISGKEERGMEYGRKIVLVLTGLSRMQLDHWAKSGIVRPSKAGGGKGTRNEYSFKDLVQLKVAKRLRDEGISLQKIRKSLAYLRKNFPEVEAPLAALHFLTNGTDLFVLTRDPKVILNTLRGQYVFSLALGHLIEGLRGELSKLSIPKGEKVKVRGRFFTVILTPDLEEGGYTVTCKEIPAAISQGETEQEAIDNIIDALELCLTTEKELSTRRIQAG